VDKNGEPTLLDETVEEEMDNSYNSEQNEYIQSTEENQPVDEIDLHHFVVPDFPKEFRKPLLKNYDLRFVLCLLLSALFHILIVYFGPDIIPDEFESKVIQKMHQRFVDTILEEKSALGSSGQETEGPTWGAVARKKSGRDMSQIIEEIILGIVQSGSELPDFSGISDKILTPEMIQEMQKALIPSGEMRKDARAAAQDRRQQTQEGISDNVGGIGLLGVITSGSGFDDYEYIADLLEAANARAQNLEGILKQVNALKVPRYQRPTAWLDNNDVSIGLKTGRIKKKMLNQEFYAQVEPLAKIEQTPIARNVDVDQLGSPLAGLNRKKAANGQFRSFKHISKVVASHNKVIQDCYKQVLKHQPHLKGKLIVRFSINPQGHVVEAEIVSSTLNNPKIERCVLQRIRRWKDFGPCDPKLGIMSFRIPYKFGMN